MSAKQNDEAVLNLAECWEAGGVFDDVTTELQSYFAGVAEEVESLVNGTEKSLRDYHGKFAAELVRAVVESQALECVQMAESDDEGVVDGFSVRVWNPSCKFGDVTDDFEDTNEALSDLLENWAQEAGPLYRKNGAAYLHRLADQLAEKVAA